MGSGDMSRKNAVHAVIIGVCVVVSVYALVARPFTRREDRVEDILAHGQHIHVICINRACRYEQDNYRVHSTNIDWPWKCPKCGQMTLCRTQRCIYCGKITASLPRTEGRTWFTCTQCGRRTPLTFRAVDVEEEARKPARKPTGGVEP